MSDVVRATGYRLQTIAESSPVRVTGYRLQSIAQASPVRVTGYRLQLVISAPPRTTFLGSFVGFGGSPFLGGTLE